MDVRTGRPNLVVRPPWTARVGPVPTHTGSLHPAAGGRARRAMPAHDALRAQARYQFRQAQLPRPFLSVTRTFRHGEIGAVRISARVATDSILASHSDIESAVTTAKPTRAK